MVLPMDRDFAEGPIVVCKLYLTCQCKVVAHVYQACMHAGAYLSEGCGFKFKNDQTAPLDPRTRLLNPLCSRSAVP